MDHNQYVNRSQLLLLQLPFCILLLVPVWLPAQQVDPNVPAQQVDPAQSVNFDFEDADLRAVIQAVAEFTGKNFLVDPRVQGRVTVVAPTPLTVEQAYK